MQYINRAIEYKILSASKRYPIVMVCGLRQVGKSTMLEHIKESGRTYVTLRDPDALEAAVDNPHGFFNTYKTPLIIDEFQLAPSLLSYIQFLVDEKKRLGEDNKGMIWLTGSQKFSMMKNVSESLAGRCAIFDMSSLSSAEIDGRDAGCFLPDLDYLRKRAEGSAPKTSQEIYERIFTGGMPELYAEETDTKEYFMNYVGTYLMRDVLEYGQIDKVSDFMKFLRYMAASTGHELNYSAVSKDLSLSLPTVRNWVSILNTLGVIHIIEPYSNNLLKRLVKTPKFYFMDTGLVSYLCRIGSSQNLMNHPLAGQLFETYVVSEIIKSYYNAKADVDLYYYRDSDRREIDLLALWENKIYPMEIKLGHSPSNADKNMFVLNGCGLDVQPCVVICGNEKMVPCGKNAWYFPVAAL
ncbi:MAG: ATP-binding protein [Clostridia bacterium]|nr:ATP-binding protein [Clostridia bacterium]